MTIPLNDLRYEIKFVVPITESYRLSAWVRQHPKAFGIAYPPRHVNNVYYDSYGLDTYEENLSGVSEGLRFLGRSWHQITRDLRSQLPARVDPGWTTTRSRC